MSTVIRSLWGVGFLAAVVVALAGCTSHEAPTKDTKAPAADKGRPDDHGHPEEGPHGGALAEWGEEEYHAEFTVDHGKKQATVYILDGSAKKAVPIQAETLSLIIKNVQPPAASTLKAEPQKDDPKGMASRFVGQHDALAKEMEFEGEISGKVGDKPYAGEFEEKAHEDHKDGEKHSQNTSMPEGVGGTPFERELFLKPGGIYTAADITANGETVPSEKYKGISWPHDDDLKPGDKVCPVTANKADLRCNWIVNGKGYDFCCTPCLDKFVKWAKEHPEKIKEPEAYTQK